MKVVSTSGAHKREDKQKAKMAKNDPFEKLKTKVFVERSKQEEGAARPQKQSVEDLENSLLAKMRAKRAAKGQ